MNTLKMLIFYLSYFLFFYLIIFSYYFIKKRKINLIFWFVLVIGLVLGYARFIEPKLLLLKTHPLKISKNKNSSPLKIVVFSDIHLGLFNNGVSLNKIVQKINKLNPDMVMIPGDFLYEISKDKIRNEILVLNQVKAPVFAVTGNHDESAPGPDYGDVLVQSLENARVNVLNNKIFYDSKKKIKIIGLSDLWASQYNLSILNDLDPEDLNILIAHNPDIAFKIKPNLNIDLIVSGHTHGGQIRIPFLYKHFIPSEYGFDLGFYIDQNTYNVFVTPGTGMVGLPFRFLMPPRIDLLEIN